MANKRIECVFTDSHDNNGEMESARKQKKYDSFLFPFPLQVFSSVRHDCKPMNESFVKFDVIFTVGYTSWTHALFSFNFSFFFFQIRQRERKKRKRERERERERERRERERERE